MSSSDSTTSTDTTDQSFFDQHEIPILIAAAIVVLLVIFWGGQAFWHGMLPRQTRCATPGCGKRITKEQHAVEGSDGKKHHETGEHDYRRWYQCMSDRNGPKAKNPSTKDLEGGEE
ncbi:hypothetical protein JCM24511_06288 [Saitozyma sp. JCM 24511]|nr:hypothetical protein JCM24511_06288 [Saitozyma sp. JCM 24511]